DASGKLIKRVASNTKLAANSASSMSQKFTLDHPHLWNGRQDPYLYTVYVTLRSGGKVIDTLHQPLGLRSFRVDPKLGFILNGKPYDLHGVAMHQDRLNDRGATSAADRAQDVSLIKEIGATFVRLAHYQHGQSTYDLLDRDGIVTWTEIPLIGSLSGAASYLANAK